MIYRSGGAIGVSLQSVSEQALADLETQRDSARVFLGEAEQRASKRIGAATLAETIMANFGDFDRLWNEGLSIEERKELLRCYVHQINVSHSPTSVQAEIWPYKIPIPHNKMTPVTADLSPLITNQFGGGARRRSG